MEQSIFFLVSGLIVIGIAIYFLIINYRKYAVIQKTETSNISMVYNGFYEVKGKVVSFSEKLVSPFTGKDCVYYNFVVEQKKSSGKSSRWVEIINDKRSVKFGIDDGTGTAIIDMQNADTQIKIDTKERSGMFNSADEREVAVLEKYNQSNKSWIFEKSLRYTEKFLEVGDELYVLGEVNEKENQKPVFRKSQMLLFVSDKSENELLNYFKVRMIIAAIVIIAVVAINGWIYLSMS